MEQYFLALIRGQKRGFLAAMLRVVLLLASIVYGAIVRLRNRFYDGGWKSSQRAAVPVISIGNLTLGGTGKTPCVEYAARRLRLQELRVAILSRGYAADRSGPNDEALVLEQNLPDVPHLQGVDRIALARTAVAELESEVLLLDDGFQHRRLQRDLDIVLVDATFPWGGGRIFPAGLLREPRSSLRRAQVVILTRCDHVEAAALAALRAEVACLAPRAAVVESRHRPVKWVNSDGAIKPIAEAGFRAALAFCGIGNPDGFRRTLRDLALNVVDFRAYPDHHYYNRADVDELHAWARRQECQAIVTTQKDLVKLQLNRLGGRDLWALQIELHVDAGGAAFDRALQSVVCSSGAATASGGVYPRRRHVVLEESQRPPAGINPAARIDRAAISKD